MKRRGMALGLAALMTCTALFTTTAKAENKGSDEKETIKFTYWGSGDEKKAIEESVDKFMEANPNIDVDLMHIPSEDFLTKLNAMIAAGEAPDVSYSASWKCQMGEDGLIYNFYDLLDDMGLSKDDYLSTCWWNWSPTESAGPVQANVTTNLMYNVDCFEEAGVDLPPTKVEDAWSWDEVVEMAQKLTLDTEGRNAADPDFDANNIKQYGVMFGTDWNVYMPFILSAGGGYLNESMDGLGLNDEKSAQILQNFADLINVYHVSPTAVQKNAMPSAATALAAKQTAMYIDGSWNHLDLMNSGCNWGVGVLPIDENYTTFFDGGSLIIFKSTKHLEASEKLYLWLTNPESSERITELYRTLWMPVQTEYYTEPDKIDFWASEELPARPEGFQDAIVKATYDHAVVATEINVKNFNEINTLVGSALEQVWSGKKTAEEAMTEVKSQTDSLASIYALLIPVNYKLKKEEITALVEAPSYEEGRRIFQKTWYGNKYEQLTVANLEEFYNHIHRSILEKESHRNPYSVAVIYSYLYNKEHEVNRLTIAIECVRYGVQHDEAMRYICNS